LIKLYDRRNKQGTACPDGKGADSVVNVFEKLHVEGLAEDGPDNSGDELQQIDSNAAHRPRRPKQKKGQKAKRQHLISKAKDARDIAEVENAVSEHEYDLEIDDSDLDFMIYCFFKGTHAPSFLL